MSTPNKGAKARALAHAKALRDVVRHALDWNRTSIALTIELMPLRQACNVLEALESTPPVRDRRHHAKSCPAGGPDEIRVDPCTCGLTALRKAGK